MNYKKEMEIMQHNLSYIRKSLNMSAKELGDMIGVTRQTINNIEIGKTKLTGPQYLAILYGLDKFIFPTLSDSEQKNIRRLMLVKVKSSNYAKSLTFEEES